MILTLCSCNPDSNCTIGIEKELYIGNIMEVQTLSFTYGDPIWSQLEFDEKITEKEGYDAMLYMDKDVLGANMIE